MYGAGPRSGEEPARKERCAEVGTPDARRQTQDENLRAKEDMGSSGKRPRLSEKKKMKKEVPPQMLGHDSRILKTLSIGVVHKTICPYLSTIVYAALRRQDPLEELGVRLLIFCLLSVFCDLMLWFALVSSCMLHAIFLNQVKSTYPRSALPDDKIQVGS